MGALRQHVIRLSPTDVCHGNMPVLLKWAIIQAEEHILLRQEA